MPIGPSRDDAALTVGLRRWVAAHPDDVPGLPAGSGAEVTSVVRAKEGMGNETLLVELGPYPGIVVRLAPLVATFPDYELGPQALVQNVVAASGVPAPAPAVVVDDTTFIGAPFLVMPRVEGRIPGAAPLFDKWMLSLSDGERGTMHDGLIGALAEVHRVDWAAAGVDSVLAPRTLADELEVWASYLEWSSEGQPLPALATALEWCRRHQPDEGEAPVLLWGDARMGNVVYDDSLAVHAVLDWDLAGIGARQMDLGWYFGLEYMMEQLFGRRVPGFPSRREALDVYTARSGHRVTDLGWHEVFALTRALAINDRHQRIAANRDREQNPMAAVLLARITEEE
ncbi:MAG TPA: phosphotransferase family protein [Acidimicrobiales bacterium]